MKKVLSLVFVLLLCFMSLTVSASAVPTPVPRLIGDMNFDGAVDIIDATLIQRCLLGLYETTSMEIIGDFDRDGEVTISDATWIQRLDAGMDIPFYCDGVAFSDIYVEFAADVASDEAKVESII